MTYHGVWWVYGVGVGVGLPLSLYNSNTSAAAEYQHHRTIPLIKSIPSLMSMYYLLYIRILASRPYMNPEI